jgi:hypothetical protein
VQLAANISHRYNRLYIMSFDEKGTSPDNQARDLAYLFRNDKQGENIWSQTKLVKKTVATALFFIICLRVNPINGYPTRSAVKGLTNIRSATDHQYFKKLINVFYLQRKTIK